jgi:glutathionyl-hydroquinone reductase
MRTNISTYRFAYIFYGTRNAQEIPANLFANISTYGDTNFNYMFANTFFEYAYNSTTATIPDSLFNAIDTSQGATFSHTFYYTFGSYARNSTNAAIIPASLFATINTSNAIDLSYMFTWTFRNCAYNSTTATIPAGLFATINTSNATDLSYMFQLTFNIYARSSTVGDIPGGLFSAIDTSSATNLSHMFSSTFSNYAYDSTVGTIPGNLFGTININSTADPYQMFWDTFSSYAHNSTVATIPAGLFSTVDTSSATNLSCMFCSVFASYAYSSTTATIPAGLFNTISTSQGTDFSYMFSSTFNNYATNSTIGTIPAGLFSTIDTSQGTDLRAMFASTFYRFARSSPVGTVPDDLFSSISTASATNLTDIFSGTFVDYAFRTAKFVVAGAQVGNTQVFTGGPYVVKVGSVGTPSNNPTVVAGDTVYPAYSNATRSIAVHLGSYTWYRKDGTSCAETIPTADCGPQDPTTEYTDTWPDTTEWTSTTSTEKGSIVFYGVFKVTMEIILDDVEANIGGASGLAPGSTSAYAYATNTPTVKTNNPHGFKLQISTDQPSTNTHASDMVHQSAAGNYIAAAANTCSWDDSTKVFTGASTPTLDNTWGFAMTLYNGANQGLCEIPSVTTPLTVRSTTSANNNPGVSTVVYYGVKVDINQAAGEYRANVVYTAVGNP